MVRYWSHKVDNSSRKGFREMDPGYVGIRANKDLWKDVCTESNISFAVLFHYQRRRENVADMARDASKRNPQSFLLVSCKLPEFFRKRLESIYAPNLGPTCMYVNPVTKAAMKTNVTKILVIDKLLVLLSRHRPFISQASSEQSPRVI